MSTVHTALGEGQIVETERRLGGSRWHRVESTVPGVYSKWFPAHEVTASSEDGWSPIPDQQQADIYGQPQDAAPPDPQLGGPPPEGHGVDSWPDPDHGREDMMADQQPNFEDALQGLSEFANTGQVSPQMQDEFAGSPDPDSILGYRYADNGWPALQNPGGGAGSASLPAGDTAPGGGGSYIPKGMTDGKPVGASDTSALWPLGMRYLGGPGDNVDHSNSVALPYNPTPQHDAVGVVPDGSWAPGEDTAEGGGVIDADQRLHPSDSLSFDKETNSEAGPYPGPAPHLFASLDEANVGQKFLQFLHELGNDPSDPLDVQDSGDWMRSHQPQQGPLEAGDAPAHDREDRFHDSELPGLDRAASLDDRAAAVRISLGDKYVTPMFLMAANHFTDPVQMFRDDPSGYIERSASIVHDADLDRYSALLDVEAREAGGWDKTAAWRDVSAKASRLRKEGRVHVKDIGPDRIYANVDGDHGTYETMITKGSALGGYDAYYSEGGQSVGNWRCSCKWGEWAHQRRFTFIGRLCSHGLASYWTMQSQHQSPDSPRGYSDPRRDKLKTKRSNRREACWPGCEENEAHAKKFHKDKEGAIAPDHGLNYLVDHYGPNDHADLEHDFADRTHAAEDYAHRTDLPGEADDVPLGLVGSRRTAVHPAVDEYHRWAEQNGMDPEDSLEHYDTNVRPLNNDEYTAIVDSISGGVGGWEPGAGPGVHRGSFEHFAKELLRTTPRGMTPQMNFIDRNEHSTRKVDVTSLDDIEPRFADDDSDNDIDTETREAMRLGAKIVAWIADEVLPDFEQWYAKNHGRELKDAQPTEAMGAAADYSQQVGLDQATTEMLQEWVGKNFRPEQDQGGTQDEDIKHFAMAAGRYLMASMRTAAPDAPAQTSGYTDDSMYNNPLLAPYTGVGMGTGGGALPPNNSSPIGFAPPAAGPGVGGAETEMGGGGGNRIAPSAPVSQQSSNPAPAVNPGGAGGGGAGSAGAGGAGAAGGGKGDYQIQSGDTLWDLSQKYLGDGSRYNEIAQANGIKDPNKINTGDSLKIPNPTGTSPGPGNAGTSPTSAPTSAPASPAAGGAGGFGWGNAGGGTPSGSAPKMGPFPTTPTPGGAAAQSQESSQAETSGRAGAPMSQNGSELKTPPSGVTTNNPPAGASPLDVFAPTTKGSTPGTPPAAPAGGGLGIGNAASGKQATSSLHLASDDALLNHLRDLSHAPSAGAHVGDMTAHTDNVRSTINELRDRGYGADQLVAMVRTAADDDIDNYDWSDDPKNPANGGKAKGAPHDTSAAPAGVSTPGLGGSSGAAPSSAPLPSAPAPSAPAAGGGSNPYGAGNGNVPPIPEGVRADSAMGGTGESMAGGGAGPGFKQQESPGGGGGGGGGGALGGDFMNAMSEFSPMIGEIGSGVGSALSGIGGGGLGGMMGEIGPAISGISHMFGARTAADTSEVEILLGEEPPENTRTPSGYAGSGPDHQSWTTSSEDYVDAHEKDNREDVTKLPDGDITKYSFDDMVREASAPRFADLVVTANAFDNYGDWGYGKTESADPSDWGSVESFFSDAEDLQGKMGDTAPAKQTIDDYLNHYSTLGFAPNQNRFGKRGIDRLGQQQADPANFVSAYGMGRPDPAMAPANYGYTPVGLGFEHLAAPQQGYFGVGSEPSLPTTDGLAHGNGAANLHNVVKPNRPHYPTAPQLPGAGPQHPGQLPQETPLAQPRNPGVGGGWAQPPTQMGAPPATQGGIQRQATQVHSGGLAPVFSTGVPAPQASYAPQQQFAAADPSAGWGPQSDPYGGFAPEPQGPLRQTAGLSLVPHQAEHDQAVAFATCDRTPHLGQYARTSDNSDVVRQFQAQMAQGQGWHTGYTPTGVGDISDGANNFLARQAGKNYSLAQQAQLEQEEHYLGARNLDQLDLTGTHYLEG